MNQRYFAEYCLQAKDDLFIPFCAQDHSHRKPSYDELLPGLALDNCPASPVSNLTRQSDQNSPKASQSTKSTQNTCKKLKKKRETTSRLASGFQRGHWKTEENKRYHWFLEVHSSHFLNKQMRRMDRIFKTMEKFVISREAEQCRSHHQKMEKKHGSFSTILKALRKTHYNSGDSEAVGLDMRSSGIQFCQELISSAELQSGASEKSKEVESQWEMGSVGEVQGDYSPSGSFVDPLQEFQLARDHLLEVLIS